MRNNISKKKKTGVVLMTYGSATVAENVPAYFERIYHGKASRELVRDFEDRYRLVGHSPLIEITAQQAALLQKQLGSKYVVVSGMRHSDPFIETAVRACKKAGAKRIVGIILSPQFSAFIMDGYRTAFLDAARKSGYQDNEAIVADPWPAEKHFIALTAKRVETSLVKLKRLHGKRVPVVFTTHSLPERVVKDDPTYLKQLKTTAEAVVKRIDDASLKWYTGYQSAGHTPESWLKPDLTDILARLKKAGHTAVLIAPIQFLADHLEILYDLDRAGAQQCAEHGMSYHRIPLPNTDPLFIKALAAVAKTTERSF